jgi:hypothetical membrane protein
MIAPLLFIGLVLVFGWLEPGYNYKTDTMSLLGGVGGMRADLFLLGQSVVGLMIIVFALGLYFEMRTAAARTGSTMLLFGGLALMGSAVFHCNAGCENILSDPNLPGRLHALFAFIAGASLAVAPVISFFGLQVPDWEQLRPLTWIIGVLANVPGLIFWVSFFTTRMPAWEGLLQRFGILFAMVWIWAMSKNLLRIGIDHGATS